MALMTTNDISIEGTSSNMDTSMNFDLKSTCGAYMCRMCAAMYICLGKSTMYNMPNNTGGESTARPNMWQ